MAVVSVTVGELVDRGQAWGLLRFDEQVTISHLRSELHSFRVRLYPTRGDRLADRDRYWYEEPHGVRMFMEATIPALTAGTDPDPFNEVAVADALCSSSPVYYAIQNLAGTGIDGDEITITYALAGDFVEPPDDPFPIVIGGDLGDLSRSHTIATRVEVLSDGLVAKVLDNVDSGEVTLDSTAASRGRVSLDLVGTEELIPTSPQSLLAPFGNELVVYRGVRLPTQISLIRLGIFRIDECEVTDEGGDLTISISGLDRSARFIEAPFEEPFEIEAGTEVSDAILAALADVTWPEFQHLFADTNVPLPWLRAEEGEDRWDFVQGLATSIGGQLYFNADGVLVLKPNEEEIGSLPVGTYSEGEDGILLGINHTWHRDTIYNKVIVTGENTTAADEADEDQPPPRGEATDDNPLSPTFYGGPFGRKPYFYPNSYISTDQQARLAARGMLVRALGAPDSIGFASIVDPRRRPGDLVRITRERLGVDEDHLIDQISIPLGPGDQMTAQTRVSQELFGGG